MTRTIALTALALCIATPLDAKGGGGGGGHGGGGHASAAHVSAPAARTAPTARTAVTNPTTGPATIAKPQTGSWWRPSWFFPPRSGSSTPASPACTDKADEKCRKL